jgi:hypothetical protein
LRVWYFRGARLKTPAEMARLRIGTQAVPRRVRASGAARR